MKFYTTYKISDNIHETPEGYLVCVGVPIARTGEYLYGPGETPLTPDESGKVVVNRDADQVFRPETLASFEGKAVTIQHPEEFVGPENWTKLAKGLIQNVRRGEAEFENDLLADLLITDQVAIGLVKGGLREVSCGYEAEYVQTGDGRGRQENIIGNHLALVQAGRAGATYAIHDHKGKGLTMKLTEKLKAIFAKAEDEATALVTDAAEPEKKDEKKEDKAKDAPAGDAGAPAADAMKGAYDELKKAFDAFGAMMGSKEEKKSDDATTPATQASPAETVAKDEPGAAAAAPAASLEERLAKLEALVQKMAGMGSMDEAAGDEAASDKEACDADKDDDKEESEDEAGEEEEAMVGDTGDTASRIEILAPGLKVEGKEARAKALEAAYQTTDGKAVIETLTGGKPPELKDEAQIATLFIAASELLKASRMDSFSKTKTRDFISSVGNPAGAMTAEKMNELNAKHYGVTTH